ncbi:MAG: glycosyl hydrolase [Patescibacteria group bacterium]|nr:glycosyl hydrolase [Patescibacteria group bacterium]MDD5715753.1 glycosyl hydrolase [Patescibacteria group bacterium]
MKIRIYVIISIAFVMGIFMLFGPHAMDAVTESTLPRITVSGTLYGYDGTPVTGGVTLRLVVGPDNNISSQQIVIGQQNIDSADGTFQIRSWDWQSFSQYFDGYGTDWYTDNDVDEYDPDTYHVYLNFNKDDKILLKDAEGVYQRQSSPARIDLGVVPNTKTVNVGDVYFQEPNISGRIIEDNGIRHANVRMVMAKTGETPTYDDQVMTYQGYWLYRETGAYTVWLYDDYETCEESQYPIPVDLTKLLRTFTITVGEGTIISADYYVNGEHTNEEGYVEVPDANESQSISSLLNGVNTRLVSKDTVGLNVHLALSSGAGFDSLMIEKLKESGTRWVRERFDITWYSQAGTPERYETVRNFYRGNDINIVGMLGSGVDALPGLTEWSEFVTEVVTEHKDYIKVWEMWNEPDLEKYFSPNTVAAYIPYLKAGYEAVKAVDPDALVLNAPISSPNASFLEGLYQQAGNYFDAPAFHVYYCDQYKSSGNLSALQRDFANALAVVNQYRPSDKIWITELGCSTYSNYSEDFQNQYFQAAVPYLLSTGKVEKVLLFNVIDRDTGDPYENDFGLLKTDFSPKPSWNWYLTFQAGSSGSNQYTAPVASGTSFFAYAQTIRGGYQISSGNVIGNAREEIITGTGDGMGPHVQVFDSNGNKRSQFFAYDQGLRNGVTVSACDVNADGHDEIVTAQGKGGWPLVRIFNAYGTQLADEFYVLDGKYTGGVNLSCGDTDGDGIQEIVVAARQGGGPHVLVYNQNGKVLTNFMAYDPNFRGGINVTTIDMDGDGKDEIVTGPQWGAPHVQIFKIRPNEVKRLSPGFYAFNIDYRGGVQVAGVDTDGNGEKELIVGVGDNATPLVRRYNIREELQQEFFAFGTNYLGGVMVAGGDIDDDGEDEILVMPRSNGGPNVRIIEPGDV